MRKLLSVLIFTLALNFLAAAGGVAYLWQSGALDRSKIQAIQAVLFPPPAPATQESKPVEPDPATQPTLKLEELLTKRSGFSAAEQVDFIQHTFDAQMAQLDRRARELSDLESSIRSRAERLDQDRQSLDRDREQLAAEREASRRLLTDKGFQDSLARYNVMQPKQVKSVFMTLDEKTMTQYLQAMEPRTAAKVIKEFKTEAETQRIRTALEAMRLAAPPPGKPGSSAFAGTDGGAVDGSAPGNASPPARADNPGAP